METRSDIQTLCLSPDNKILIAIDVDGYSLIINFYKKVVLAHFNFKGNVTAIRFSPDSKFLAVATGHKLRIF